MHNFFIKQNQLKDNIEILGNDVNHIKNVLRLQLEDEICVHVKDINEKYICKIKETRQTSIICDIIKKVEIEHESDVYINIVQALPKSDKMELIIQKCTELGVKEFTPLQLNRCIVKISSKDEKKKTERWQTIAEVASKQCSRDIVPKVNNIYNIHTLKDLLNDYDIVLVTYENENINTLKNEISKFSHKTKKIAVVIGPEGGIEEHEIAKLKEYGYKILGLGKRILRTETVAICVSSIILYTLGDLGGK